MFFFFFFVFFLKIETIIYIKKTRRFNSFEFQERTPFFFLLNDEFNTK